MLSDGEIYYNIRCLEDDGDEVSADSYKTKMLSRCKRLAFNHLTLRPKIRCALDRVMEFRGLRSGLQLGNIDKVLASNCDEMVENYFNWICSTWNDFLQDDQAAKRDVDEFTVKLFEFRVPCASRKDSNIISFSMNTGLAFSEIQDERFRIKIKASVLSLRAVIPSLATFHENMKYICIGAKILRTHLDLPLEKESLFEPRETTLYERLASDWDETCQPLVEIDEGHFLPLLGESSPWIAFKQLFLSVLRQFPNLSTETPLRDFRREAMPAGLSARYLSMLFQRASMLGFCNNKINKGLDRSLHYVQLPNFEPRINEPISDWRGGKPFVRTFLASQKLAFLPTLRKRSAYFEGPTVEFVYKDLIDAFFGQQEMNIDYTKPRIFMEEVGSSIMGFPMVQDDNGQIDINAPKSDAAAHYAGNEMEEDVSDVDMSTDSVSESTETRKTRQEQIALKRKAVLRKLNLRRMKRQENGLRPQPSRETKSSGHERQKGNLRPTWGSRIPKSRKGQRPTKDADQVSRREKEFPRAKRRQIVRHKPRLVAPPLSTIVAPQSDITLPDPLNLSQAFDENTALILHPLITADKETVDSDGGSGDRLETPGESGRDVISAPDLPPRDLDSQTGSSQMAMQLYIPQREVARVPLQIPSMPPRGLDYETGPSQMAIQRYVPQSRAARAPLQIPSMAHATSENTGLPEPIDSTARNTSGTPVSVDGEDAPRDLTHPSEAEYDNLEAPREASPSNSSASSWTDQFPVIDESEALLHQNTTIGRLMTSDETKHESSDEAKRKRKRKRQSYSKDTERTATAEEETIQRDGLDLIHKARKIFPLKNSQREGRKQEGQLELKTISHTQTERPNQRGQEISIRNVQSMRPAKRSRLKESYGNEDVEATFVNDMTDIPLTPAEAANPHYAPRGHRPQPRKPLTIPGNFSTGAT